jgi:hypothetical protein
VDDVARALLGEVKDLVVETRGDVKELRDEVGEMGKRFVSVDTWRQRNIQVDDALGNLNRELLARKVPWTSVAAVVIAAVALIR